MLIDLDRDPGELQNLASDPAYRQRLETGRRLLKEWYASHGLTLGAKYIVERESGNH
jgi:ribosomal protein S18 acetylase RimI-like enzyme